MSLRRMKHEIVEELKKEIHSIIEEALVEESYNDNTKIEWGIFPTNDRDSVIVIPGETMSYEGVSTTIDGLVKYLAKKHKRIVVKWNEMEFEPDDIGFPSNVTEDDIRKVFAESGNKYDILTEVV